MVIGCHVSQSESRFQRIDDPSETGMISRWLHYASTSVFSTHTGSPVSGRRLEFAESSVTRRRASSRLCGAQKNGLQGMWSSALGLVRPDDTARSRSFLRRHAGLSGIRGSTGSVSTLRQGEARTTRLPCRQSVLHQAVRLVRRPALPDQHDPGRGRGTAPGLAYGQGTGQAVHADPAGADRYARAEGHRHRRDLDPQGTHLSHCGERPDPSTADLVWRRGSLGSQHGAVLRLAGREEDARHSAGGDGHVEAVSQCRPPDARRRPPSCSTSSM